MLNVTFGDREHDVSGKERRLRRLCGGAQRPCHSRRFVVVACDKRNIATLG